MEKRVETGMPVSRRRLLIIVIALILLIAALITYCAHANSDGKDVRIKDTPVALQGAGSAKAPADSHKDGSTKKSPGAEAVNNDQARADKAGDKKAERKIKVLIQIECKTLLGIKWNTGVKIPKDGIIKEAESLSLPAGATVKDALDALEVKYKASYSYVSSIGGIPAGEFGDGSAWFFKVNDRYPEKSYDSCKLKDGDRLAWRYSVDGGIDIGVIGPDVVSGF